MPRRLRGSEGKSHARFGCVLLTRRPQRALPVFRLWRRWLLQPCAWLEFWRCHPFCLTAPSSGGCRRRLQSARERIDQRQALEIGYRFRRRAIRSFEFVRAWLVPVPVHPQCYYFMLSHDASPKGEPVCRNVQQPRSKHGAHLTCLHCSAEWRLCALRARPCRLGGDRRSPRHRRKIHAHAWAHGPSSTPQTLRHRTVSNPSSLIVTQSDWVLCFGIHTRQNCWFLSVACNPAV